MSVWIVYELQHLPGEGIKKVPVAEVTGIEWYAELVARQCHSHDFGTYQYEKGEVPLCTE